MLWNGSQKCTRGPLTSCMLHASGCALWGRTIMPQHVKLFAAFACFPAVMGHGFLLVWRSSWLSVFYKSSLFRVPDIFSAGQFFVLESQKMSKHASNARKSREPGTVRNRSWPFLTVPSTRDAPTIHVYNAAKLYFIVFWPLFHCARTGRERFWTSSGLFLVHRYTWILLFYGLCNYIILIVFLHIDLRTMLPCGHDFIFSVWQV